MERSGTLERSWYATTPGGYLVRVEEHRSDLMYIVEFYDGSEFSGERILTHCPVSGEVLSPEVLQEAKPEFATA